MNLFSNLPPQSASDEVKAAHIAKYKASKKADNEPAEEPPKVEIDVEAVRKRAAELLASAQETAENAVSPWRRYRLLQKKDPQAAGEYWRKNKAAIKACYHH